MMPMTAVYIVLVILAVILLLCLLRVGVRVEYSEGGLAVWIKLCFLSFQVLPVKRKKRKEERQKSAPERPPQKKGGSFELVKELLPVAVDALGGLKRKISIDDIQIDLLWSLSDPSACAVGYGALNAAIGMIWPVIEQNFCVRQRRIRTAVDFDQGKPTIYILAQASIRVGQLICWAVRLIVEFLKIYQTRNKQQDTVIKQQKEAV